MAPVVMLPSRGRQPTPDGRQMLRLYPLGYGERSGHGHWIYAVGYSGGKVKLGRSSKPRSRLLQHWIAADGAVEWVHLFSRFRSNKVAAATERLALRYAAEISTRIRITETFRGLSRADALSCVRRAITEQGG